MKTTTTLSLAVLATMATAQLLTSGHGQLPACAQQCSVLTSAQSSCGTSWSCFCPKVWQASNENLATACSDICTNTPDNAAVASWYIANCGSDNGASEHGDDATSTSTASGLQPSSGTTSTGVHSAKSAGDDCSLSWWHCHWQWIVMVIVLVVALSLLGFGARWIKKRYDRKHDQNLKPFNAGVTTRSVAVTDDKFDNSLSSAATFVQSSNVDSPARTREAFMPYGYGYTRSESRNGGGAEDSTLRGGTPYEEMEKGTPESTGDLTRQETVSGRVRKVLTRQGSKAR